MQARSRTLPRVRSPELEFTSKIPRHWFDGNVIATHLTNGVGMLFPAGERFFVRSVRRFQDHVEDADLRAQIDRFFKQEGRHAREHDRMTTMLAEQGFAVGPFLALYERVAYGWIEKLSSPKLRLATTAACEHFTALLAEEVLRTRVLDTADPTVRALLLWHAAEEIEHRAVAFDVLTAVAPSYALRMAGLAMASLCLAGFWMLATACLLYQDRHVGLRRLWRDFRATLDPSSKSVFVQGIRMYVRRGFHPSDLDLDELAASYLASAGLEPAERAA